MARRAETTVRSATLVAVPAVAILGLGTGYLAHPWWAPRARSTPAVDAVATPAGPRAAPAAAPAPVTASPSAPWAPVSPVLPAPPLADSAAPGLVPREIMVRDPDRGESTAGAASQLDTRVFRRLATERDGVSFASCLEAAGVALPVTFHFTARLRSTRDRVELVRLDIDAPTPTAPFDACARTLLADPLFEPRRERQPEFLELEGAFQSSFTVASLSGDGSS